MWVIGLGHIIFEILRNQVCAAQTRRKSFFALCHHATPGIVPGVVLSSGFENRDADCGSEITVSVFVPASTYMVVLFQVPKDLRSERSAPFMLSAGRRGASSVPDATRSTHSSRSKFLGGSGLGFLLLERLAGATRCAETQLRDVNMSAGRNGCRTTLSLVA